MSSSREGERFTIGAHVDATDGRCGHLVRVILDPASQSLTHLVVQPGHHEERARLVPVDLVTSVEDDLIRLNRTKAEFEHLDSAEDVQFLSDDATGLGYGEDPSARTTGHLPGKPMFSDRVPLGEVEIRRGDPVHASDGWIGSVQGLVLDPADHNVTHVILQEGHVWGRKQVAIPIGAVNRAGGELRVDLTKDEIEGLPPVSLRSHG
jgi:sporulation protein YlmC with PRC-barrel domain